MKTNTNLISRLLLSCFLLFIVNFSAQAQYPTAAAPINGVPNSLDCGNLDQLTNYIWAKVNGNIVSSPNPQTPADFTTKVVPGASLEVNFNVNKIRNNRYSLVSYRVVGDKRIIFDYQSNLFTTTTPLVGNSYQQKVLIPTCQFEVYFVKGCIIEEFDPTDANKPGYLTGNIIDFDMGGAGLVCNDCPAITDNSNCFDAHLLEVIDIPATLQKELIFSVVNTSGANSSVSTCGGELMGDVIFTNIQSSQTHNNTPYSFRFNYQLGRNHPSYPIPTNPAMSPTAFVFDQRNNHNFYAYDLYQSEIYRFRVSNTEYDRLIDKQQSPTGGAFIAPQICIELSNKQPQPGQTLPPVYCETIDFANCGGCPDPIITECKYEDCCYLAEFFGSPGGSAESFTRLRFSLQVKDATCLGNITNVKFTFQGGGNLGSASNFMPTTGYVFNYTSGDNFVTYAPTTASGTLGPESFLFDVPNTYVNANRTVIVTFNSASGSFSRTFNLAISNDPANPPASECGFIVPLTIPLPVELTSFTGKPVNEGIALNWKTASEKDNDRFEVERSVDGRNFEKIGTVKGNGTSNVAHSYSFLDKSASAGINYYRLNQVDFDGTNARSQTIKVSAEKAGRGLGVQLIPNPCADQNCTVKLQGVDTSQSLTVELRDLTGRLIFSQQVAADQTSFQMPRVATGNGIYILSARNGNNTSYQKIIIQE